MDFSMKNNKIVNHFSNFKERSTITPMEVLADGTQMKTLPLVIVDWAASAATIPPACCWTIK